jgi:hypothetical protein
MTRAADHPDDLIDPPGMNADRAVLRTFGRRFCEIGFYARRGSLAAFVVQPIKI